jgi:leucine dehydrogenase
MKYIDLDASDLSKFSDYDGHEVIRNIRDEETGLNAYVGVHNRNMGPALGGCRMYTYASDEDAITDVLRLSRGMTYKNALAGLPLGGGKSVIVGNPFEMKTDTLMAEMGKGVDSLEGRYITAEDSGSNVHDMQVMNEHTKYVVGIPSEGGDLGGDPSPFTAYGIYCGIKAAAQKRYGSSDMKGIKVAIQGMGAVGYRVAKHLHEDGAELVITDVRDDVLQKVAAELSGTQIVSPDEIFGVEAQIFSPNALGAQINDVTIPQLKVDIVAGGANNQLATSQSGVMLAEKNILYVPDYVINAGGVIAVAYEYFDRINQNPFAFDLNRDNLMKHIEGIGKTIGKIFNVAEQRSITTDVAADELAEAIFSEEHSALANGTH